MKYRIIINIYLIVIYAIDQQIYHTTYLNRTAVKRVKHSPANDVPHPIHVIICNATGFFPLCDVSISKAKLVKWLHSHLATLLATLINLQPSEAHLPKLSKDIVISVLNLFCLLPQTTKTRKLQCLYIN